MAPEVLTIGPKDHGDQGLPHVPRDVGKGELAPDEPGPVAALGLLCREVALDDARHAVDLLDVAVDGGGDLF